MNLINELKKEESDIRRIWQRILKRDFSGNEGITIKNSIFQFSTTVIAKIGSFIFTIILARMLLPELFGLYSLALSTILIFSSFSDFGVGSTLVRFVSKSLGEKNQKRAKAYLVYLGKIKILLVVISVIVLVLSAKFISEIYYQKPLFLALLAGAFYVIFLQIATFFDSIIQSSNHFKGLFFKEIFFQISRIILVPLTIFFAIKYSLSDEKILFLIILFLSISYLFASLFLWVNSLKKTVFLREKYSGLTKKQIRKVNLFLVFVSVTALSSLFFSFIDRVMLGRFVEGEFIGYYSAAFSLIGALSSFVGFGAAVLLPIFSRIQDQTEKIEKAMKKALRVMLPIGIILFFTSLTFAHLAIIIFYGSEYTPAINLLRLLSLLIIILPITGLYSSYFMSKGKPKIITILLIASTIINIILNYILITSLLRYGQLAAVYGASIATIISQFLYILGLFIYYKKEAEYFSQPL